MIAKYRRYRYLVSILGYRKWYRYLSQVSELGIEKYRYLSEVSELGIEKYRYLGEVSKPGIEKYQYLILVSIPTTSIVELHANVIGR